MQTIIALPSIASTRFPEKLRKEVPHLLWHLLHDFKLPKKMQWRRGEPCYRAPELVSIAHEDDAVTRLLWLIGKLNPLPAVALAAPDWEKRLREELDGLAAGVLGEGDRKLSVGHVLRDAKKRFPGQVFEEGEKHGGLRKWRVVLAL